MGQDARKPGYFDQIFGLSDNPFLKQRKQVAKTMGKA